MAAVVIGLAGLFMGAAGYALGVLVAPLIFAWRHDNDVGLFFPLAILFVLIVLTLVALIALLSLIH